MATYDDYLKKLESVADNAKKEHIAKFENEIKQLNLDLSKLEDLSKELTYNYLVQSKKNVAPGDLYGYQELARNFWAISNYKDSAELGDECQEQYLALKNRREEEERIAREERRKRETEEKLQKEREEKLQKDRDEKARKLLEELKPQEEKQRLTPGEKTLIEFLPLFFGLFGGIIGLLKGEGIGYAIFCAILFAIIGNVFSAIVKKIYF